MAQQQQFLRVIGICVVLGILTWCQQQNAPISHPLESEDISSVSIPSSDVWTSGTVVSDIVTHQQLVIHPGCIGCGHCVRFAPTNFAMDWRQAHVVSQDNLDTENIQQAIRNCKAQVIELVEVS